MAGRDLGSAMTVGLSEREAWSRSCSECRCGRRPGPGDPSGHRLARAGLAHLLWWDPSVRIVLVARDETGERIDGGRRRTYAGRSS